MGGSARPLGRRHRWRCPQPSPLDLQPRLASGSQRSARRGGGASPRPGPAPRLTPTRPGRHTAAAVTLEDVRISPHTLGRYVVPEAARGGVCVDVGANVGSFVDAYRAFFGQILYYEAN